VAAAVKWGDGSSARGGGGNSAVRGGIYNRVLAAGCWAALKACLVTDGRLGRGYLWLTEFITTVALAVACMSTGVTCPSTFSCSS
jgi:hypothetical protein